MQRKWTSKLWQSLGGQYCKGTSKPQLDHHAACTGHAHISVLWSVEPEIESRALRNYCLANGLEMIMHDLQWLKVKFPTCHGVATCCRGRQLISTTELNSSCDTCWVVFRQGMMLSDNLIMNTVQYSTEEQVHLFGYYQASLRCKASPDDCFAEFFTHSDGPSVFRCKLRWKICWLVFVKEESNMHPSTVWISFPLDRQHMGSTLIDWTYQLFLVILSSET